MYFTQKILRFVGRLILKLLLWPVRMGWRLLKQRRSDDSTDTNWTERDEATSNESPNVAASTESTPTQSGDTARDETGGDRPAAVEEPPSTAEATATAGPAIDAGALSRFRRVLPGAGVVSGLSAIVSPFMFGLPLRYFGEAGLLGRLLVDGLIPIVVAGVLAWGVIRRGKWAWYGGMGWGALIILTYPLRAAVPAILLAPFGSAWLVLGNIGALVDLYDPLATLSAIGVGGVVLFTGYQAHPDGWAAAPTGTGQTDESEAVDTANEGGVADPTGSSGTDPTPTSASAETGEPAETSDDSSATPSAETDTAATVSEADTEADESSADPATEAAADADETAAPASAGSDSDPAESGEPSRSDADPLDEYREKLTADEPATRREAIQSLAETTAEGAVPEQAVIDALADRLENDNDASVRVSACEALGQLGTDADRARKLLEDHRLDADGDVSRAASRALRNTDP